MIKDLGRFRANPLAEATNNLKLTDTCDTCGNGTVCQDNLVRATIANTVKVVSFTYQGVLYTATAPIVVTDEDGIADWIYSVLATLEVDLYVTVTYDAAGAGTFTVTHIGEGAISTLAFDSGAAATVTRICTSVNICDYKVRDVEGAVGELTDGVTSVVLTNTPYAYTGVTVTDDATAVTLAADIVTALGTLGTTYISVTVTVDIINGAYDITVNAIEPITLRLGTQDFTPENCVEAFA